MRKEVLIVCFLLSSLLLGACLRHKPATADAQSFTGDSSLVILLIQDSEGALLPHAHLIFSDGTPEDSTSWDGRCVFMPRTSSVNVKVSAEGYLPATFAVKGYTTHVLTLKPDPSASRPANHPLHRGLLGAKATKRAVAYGMEEEVAYTMLESAVMTDDAETDAVYKTVEGGNSVSAGKLTAGEVNDFAKWYMWDSVLFGSHKQFSHHWQICASERYTAQVLSQEGTPVVNRQVSLVDARGNTLFQARTDNTGRAELWNNLINAHTPAAAGSKLYLSVEQQRREAIPFARGLNTIRLDEPCDTVADADVFFIVDATGSMGDEIHYLQAEMKDVIRRSQNAVPGLAIRTGALVYRDHGDEYLTRISRLSDDIQTTQDFIDRQHANGGGDYEEAIPEALMATLNVAGWNDGARARIAFLILDAPCHRDSATLALLHEQVLNAAALGVRVVPVVCSGLQPNGELLMRQIALATNGTSFFLTDDSGIGETHLRPTTDSLVVEHLNDMMVRTIIEFASMPHCTDVSAINSDAVEPFLPKPSATTDDPETPVLRAGEVLTVHPNPCSVECHYTLLRDVEELYLVDMSGKVMQRPGAQVAGDYTISVASLSVGIYFLSAYCEGRWVTVKVLVK